MCEILDAEHRQFGDILTVDLELERLPFEPGTAADRTNPPHDELLFPFVAFAAGTVLLLLLDIVGHTLPGNHVVTRTAQVMRIDPERFGIAVQDSVQRLLAQRSDGIVDREIVFTPQCLNQREKEVIAVFTQRFDRAFADRFIVVGDDPFQIEDRFLAQSVANAGRPPAGS